MKTIILATIAISLSSLAVANAGNERPGFETPRLVRQNLIHQNADANHPKDQAGAIVQDASPSRSYTSPIVLDRPAAAYSYHEWPQGIDREDVARTNSIRANAGR